MKIREIPLLVNNDQFQEDHNNHKMDNVPDEHHFVHSNFGYNETVSFVLSL